MQTPWDDYWKSKKAKSSAVYDLIATFYRYSIIKRNLNRFLYKYFPPDSVILHAGCGSGQVDEDAIKKLNIISLDISVSALKLNQRSNKHDRPLINGDIFNLPFKDSSLDGIYNLGVMEHFTEDEISAILKEFKRVLKPGGKIVLFWPPEFGTSVIFLKGVHYLLNNILKKNINLHPEEITRIRSKSHIENILKRSGLRAVEHYFGARDAFTYYVVVCERTSEDKSVIMHRREINTGLDGLVACPECKYSPLEGGSSSSFLCPKCNVRYLFDDGIYFFLPKSQK